MSALEQPAGDLAAEIMRVGYWARVERLLEQATEQGCDLAVSAPRFERNGDQWNLVWEHRLLERGGQLATRPGECWHLYRLA